MEAEAANCNADKMCHTLDVAHSGDPSISPIEPFARQIGYAFTNLPFLFAVRLALPCGGPVQRSIPTKSQASIKASVLHMARLLPISSQVAGRDVRSTVSG